MTTDVERLVMRWQQTQPVMAGFYLWKKTRRSRPWHFNMYRIENDCDGVTCWEAGTEVMWPVGGWWYGPVPYPDA